MTSAQKPEMRSDQLRNERADLIAALHETSRLTVSALMSDSRDRGDWADFMDEIAAVARKALLAVGEKP